MANNEVVIEPLHPTFACVCAPMVPEEEAVLTTMPVKHGFGESFD
jgi:hypothetical protein